MKKVLFAVCSFFAIIFAALLINSCEVGLGESVDSESPTVAISYPPEQAVIRGTFVAAGTCNDDKGIKSVKVSIYSPSDESLSFGPYEASVSNGKKWRVNLNEHDESKYANYNGWQIPDGTYTIKVSVEDNAGRTQETPATQTVDIDNTAPIFIVSAPGKKYSNNSGYYKYGSAFTVSGTIAEKHKPDLTVNIYDESSSENPIVFTEKEVDTSGTSSIEFARYIKNSASQKVVNYANIYKDEITDDSGTKNFKLSVLLSDNAREYKNPEEKSNLTGGGNTTSKVFLYDEVYTTYQSAQVGLGLTAEDFKNILNGTKTGEISGQGKATGSCEEVRNSLNNLFLDTTQTNLAFSLNPNANPIYSISGFALSGTEFNSETFVSNASKGSTITATVSAGENGTNILPSSLKMWLYYLDSAKSSYTNEEIAEEIRKLENAVYNGTSDIITDESGISSILDWTLIASNENSNDSSATSYTYSGKIPVAMKQGDLYLIAVTGTDADSAYLSQETFFGFKGVVSGMPPTLSFENITDQTYTATSDEISFNVISKSEEVQLTKVQAVVSVKDESSGKIIEGLYKAEKDLKGAYSDTWNFKLSDVTDYSKIKLTKECGKSYLYTIRFTAENISGTYSETLNLHVDAIKPMVNITSVTPYVAGSDRTDISGIDENKYYLNGNITVNGSVIESNLKDVSYAVYVDGNTKASISGSLGSVYQYQIPVDTTEIEDKKEIKIVITATDNVGNSGSYDTTAYNDSNGAFVVFQETDKPQITLKNADSSGTDAGSILDGNRFTNATSNKIQAEIKDDDGIAKVIVTVYKPDGKTVIAGPKEIYSASANYKTSYNLNYELPAENGKASEGIYGIKIEVQDSTYKSESDNLRKQSAGIFYVGVDTADPVITETKVGESGATTKEKSIELSGSASDTNGIQIVKIVDTSKENKEYVASYSDGAWSYKIENLSDGLHALQITATDTTGRTKTITRNITIDTKEPNVERNAENASVYLDQSSYITLSAKSEDVENGGYASGVANVYVFAKESGEHPSYTIGDADWVSMTKTSSGYSATINLSDAAYNVSDDKVLYAWFASVDNAGNCKVSENATKIVCDASVPVISKVKSGEIVLLSGGTLKSNSENVALNVIVTDTNVEKLVVVSANGIVSSGSSTASSGLTSENGVTITEEKPTTGRESIYNVNYTINTDGSDSSVVFKAIDKNGRESENFTVVAKCDKIAPTVEITNPSSEQIQTTSLTVSGNFKEENLANINVTLTPIDSRGNTDSTRETKIAEASVSVGTSSGTGTWNAKFYELSEGAYKINVSAVDEYSNSTPSPAEKRFTLDVTPPAISKINAPTSAVNKTFELSGSVSDTYLSDVTVSDSLDNTKSWKALIGDTNSNDEKTWSVTLAPSADGTGTDSTKNYTKDGTHIYTITAKDQAGNVTTKTVQVVTDVTPPAWNTPQKIASSKETAPYIRNSGMTATVNSTETTLYDSTSLTFAAKAMDLTSGIKELVYKVDGNSEVHGDNANFTPEFENGFHSVTLKAVDEAGNETPPVLFSFFVDSFAPSTATLKSVDSDSKSDVEAYANQTTQKLVNGKADVTFSLYASDYGEDVGSTGSPTASGIAGVALTKIGNKPLNPVINGKLLSDSSYSIEIPKENLSSGAVTVKVTDKAGNFSEFALFNLDLDDIVPSVTLNAPKDADSNTKDKIDVNGTIVLNGTASDNKSLGSNPIVVEYNTTSPSAADGWKTLATKYENSSFSATLDTTVISDKSNVYIRAMATDFAGNKKETQVLTLYVNQNSDRPVIQIINIDNSSAWLTSKTLRGTITDDDGISSFQISEDGSSYTTLNLSNGSWDYDITSGDGEGKNVYFKVTDSAGATFITGGGTAGEKTPYYLFAKTTSTDAGYSEYGFENTSALSLKLDTQTPLLGTAGLDIKTSGTSLAGTGDVVHAGIADYEIKSNRYAGGSSKYIKFYVPAFDENIDKVTVSITGANGNNETANLKDVSTGTEAAITGTEITLKKTAVVSTGSTPTAYTYYESSPLSVGAVTTGQKSVIFVVSDKAGNLFSKTESFYIDNSVGEDSITITSPDSSDEVTGTVNVVGITSDVGIGIESIEWLVPRKGEKGKTDAQLSALEGWTNSNNTKSTGLFNFQFFAGGQYDLINYDNITSYDVEHNESTNIYTIPLYLKATDKLGNFYIKKDFHITHNPDADRPVTEINYPTSNDYDSGVNYITLSGTIRLNGTVQIPSGTTNVGKVFIQIGSVGEDGNIDWNNANAELTKEFATLGGIVTPTKNSDETYSIIDSSSGITYAKTTYVTSDWWGIPCTTKSANWSISINTNGDLNPSSANKTTNIAVRACAINEDGKMGLWTTVKTAAPVIHIDQNAPSQTAVVRQYSNFAENSLDSNISVQKDYVSEMYLKGKYYLVVTLSDNDSLNESSINVKRGSATISDWVKSEQIKGTDNRIYRKIYIPVDTTSMTTSSVNYTVYVEDSSGHSSTNTYTFYIDNTAPAFDILKGNEQNLLGENVPVVQNSNYAYTLSGAMTEAGSGLERVLFYFLRQDGTDTTGSSKRMLDAMVKYDDYKSDATDFYVSNLNEYILSQGSESFAMYGKTYSGSLDENRTTFTISDSSYNNNVHIRAGGLIYIGGEYHKISSINDSSIIFEGEVPDSIIVQEAGFPYGQVVDCTEKAILDSSNKYVITSDDGDGMPETMTKVATIYNWDGSIYSDVMPDGPCEIVLIAFDKAGNVSGKTIKTSIQNNAPRIAKLHIGTDLTGDGKYSDSEFNTYSFISGDAKQDLFKDSVDFKTGDSNYGYEKPFKITNGLAVVPEFTGGNGDIYMKFLNDASSVKNYQQKSGESDSSFYTAENDNSKVKAMFSVNKNTTTGLENTTKSFVVNDENLKNLEDGTGKAMSFTFWDSTDGTTCGIDSNYCFVRISDFTLGLKDTFAPTTVVNPFYWNSLTDNSIYGSDKAKSYKDLQGHIELEADLPSGIFSSDKTGVYDLDPKVSGKVTLTGYAYDDQRLGKISVKFTDGLLSAETEVATYSNGTWDIPQKSITSDGYEFTVSSNEEDGAYFNQNGHKVYWTLSLDTEKITNFAKADVRVTVKATDAKGANGGNITSTTDIVNAETDSSGTRTIIDGTTNYPVYKMDVVPYITKITTSLSAYYSSNPSVYARSALGKYVTREGESVHFAGFNIGTNNANVTIPGMAEKTLVSGKVNNANVNNTITLDKATGYDSKGATSGEISVTVNGVSALNNKNNNDAKGSYSGNVTDSDYLNAYNRQPNGLNNNILSDDLYIDVWEFINAAEPKNGKSDNPTMKISPKGRIGISYSNAVVYFSAPFIGNGKVVSPENAYSQTAIAKNYGWFTNNTFCWDQYGYPYAAAQSPDTDTQVGAAFLQFFSRQTGRSINSMDLNENYQKIKNSSRIEAICIPINSAENEWTTDIDRTQSICMTTSMQNPNNAPSATNKVTVHMAYWDNLTKQIRYRQGKVGANPGDFGFVQNNGYKNYGGSLLDLQGTESNADTQGSRYNNVYDSISQKFTNESVKSQHIYRVAGTSLGSNYANAYQVTTTYQGGKYVDIGVLPSTSTSVTPTVVICWYDGVSKNLVLSYDTPSDSDTDKQNGMYTGNWQAHAGVVSSSGGSYCRMAIDSDDGIHIAHYDNLTADLLYTYVPVSGGVPQINSARTITVDSFLSVGTWCTIDVAKDSAGNHVPQIGYFVPACEDTSAAARIAYPVLFDESKNPTLAGAEAEKFTGNWEISTVPTSNIPIIDRVNVGVYKNDSGVIQAIPTGGLQYKKTSNAENNAFPVSDSTTVYGNGTTNPAVVYSIDDGPIELAQKK